MLSEVLFDDVNNVSYELFDEEILAFPSSCPMLEMSSSLYTYWGEAPPSKSFLHLDPVAGTFL